MLFTIDIQGDELNELTDIVTDINNEPSSTTITRDQYLTNICMNFLTPRIRAEYEFAAKYETIENLKGKIGTPAELKAKRKKVK